MNKHTHKKKHTNATARMLVAWGIVVIIGLFISKSIDAQAAFRCHQLQAQAAEFDRFYMTETEKTMCDDVGVKVEVRYPTEMLNEKEREDKSHHYVVYLDEATDTIPLWYVIQQNGAKADRAHEFLRDKKLQRICACESTGNPDGIPQQFERDGVTVLKGRITPGDKGMCQISMKHWGKVAEQIGINIMEPFGNVAMANYIYDNYGAKPWYLSKACHGVD